MPACSTRAVHKVPPYPLDIQNRPLNFAKCLHSPTSMASMHNSQEKGTGPANDKVKFVGKDRS